MNYTQQQINVYQINLHKKMKRPRKEKKRIKKAIEYHHKTFRLGNLTVEETREICTLDYVLTWGYSDDLQKDENRYRELSKKRWNEL